MIETSLAVRGRQLAGDRVAVTFAANFLPLGIDQSPNGVGPRFRVPGNGASFKGLEPSHPVESGSLVARRQIERPILAACSEPLLFNGTENGKAGNIGWHQTLLLNGIYIFLACSFFMGISFAELMFTSNNKTEIQK
nr:hypothetical protein [uncultured Planococcus sp.]